MRYETVKKLSDEDFKRSTGVRRRTFEKMLEVITVGLRDFGRPPTLSRAEQLLLTLMYWREYRNVLVQSKQFHLPGKKTLQPGGDTVIEIVLVDATEQPIERLKKDNAGMTAVKRNITPKKHS